MTWGEGRYSWETVVGGKSEETIRCWSSATFAVFPVRARFAESVSTARAILDVWSGDVTMQRWDSAKVSTASVIIETR